MSKIIGYAVVLEAFDYSVPQEFAGASETVRVEAGRYAIEQRRDSYHRPYFGIAFEGTCTYRGWFGTNTRVSHPNTPASEFSQLYDYEIAMAALGMRELCVGRVNGKPLFATVELVEGVVAKPVPSGIAALEIAA